MANAEKPLVNRVARSGLITIDLEEYAPKADVAHFDLREFLFQGLVLREKEFRQAMKEHDWSAYREKILLVYCSTDAIIPTWAFMLVTSKAIPFAQAVFHGDYSRYLEQHFRRVIENLDTAPFDDGLVVVKGCAREEVPASAYVMLQQKLQPVVRSLMYGEPCSTVPVFKRK